MSTIDPGSLPSLLQHPDTASANIQENFLLVASACLYYYDCLLMLPAEVRLIWRSPWNVSTSFYIAIRYGFFLQITLTLIYDVQLASGAGANLTVYGCERLQGFIVILNVINFAVISAFIATRLFAMYARNWYLGVVMFILGTLSPSSITQATVFAFPIVVAPWPLARCLSIGPEHSPWTKFVLRYGPIGFSVTNVVYEALCLGLTVAKTVGVYREQRRLRLSPTLSSLFLRDGTLYFGVLFLLAILNIVAAANTSDLPGFWSTDTDIARVIVPILTTRFIIHLRGMSQDNVRAVLSDFNSVELADISSIRFLESGVGSMRHRDQDRRAAQIKESIDGTVDSRSIVVTRSGRGSNCRVGAADADLLRGSDQC